MRLEAIDMLVAKLNDHYVFPDKAKQIETVLRQRQHEAKDLLQRRLHGTAPLAAAGH